MDTREAYNKWAAQYDTNENRTRDLEAKVLRQTLSQLSFRNCLEIGCGTGKNSVWLVEQCDHLTGIDLSEEMLAKAKARINNAKAALKLADITQSWSFANKPFDLIAFSLVLEHIENLGHIFREAAACLAPGGYIYIGELHPFKQYSGSKARFETEETVHIVPCFDHHLSDFVTAAKKHGLTLIEVDEYFDDNNRATIPRILMLLFQKKV